MCLRTKIITFNILYFVLTTSVAHADGFDDSNQMAQRDAAFNGTDVTLSLSRLDGRDNRGPFVDGLTLLRVNGTPSEAFRERWIEEQLYTDLSFSCVPGQNLSVKVLLRKRSLPEAENLDLSSTLSLFVRPYQGSSIEAPAEVLDVQTLDGYSFAWVEAEFPAQAIAPVLRDTSNLSFTVMENGRASYYEGGGGITDFDVHGRPLVNHCALEAPSEDQPLFVIPG